MFSQDFQSRHSETETMDELAIWVIFNQGIVSNTRILMDGDHLSQGTFWPGHLRWDFLWMEHILN